MKNIEITPMKWALLAAFFISLGVGCDQNPDEEQLEEPATELTVTFLNKKLSKHYTIGDSVLFQFSINLDTVGIDSIIVSQNGEELARAGGADQIAIGTANQAVGTQNFRLIVKVDDGTIKNFSANVEFFSDIVPMDYSYERVSSYTHDPDAYTQGLFFEEGFLYESTGRKGESNLRKVELETGKVLQQMDLSDDYFGEGSTKWNDQVVMLTWKAKKGFVYNFNDFTEIKTFTYPTEGWGLTATEDHLVMSDGTENLYFLDPESLIEVKKLQVYNDRGPLKNLNELEYIDGKIYANVYQTDNVAIIDPENGKVMGLINLENLFTIRDYNRRIDVLNGIAYDRDRNRIFVTGKWWPRLYEIKLIPLDNS